MAVNRKLLAIWDGNAGKQGKKSDEKIK